MTIAGSASAFGAGERRCSVRILVAIAAIAAIAANDAICNPSNAQDRAGPEAPQALPATSAIVDYEIEPTDRMMELTTDANVRAGPSTRFEVLGIGKLGERFRVTGRVKDRNWVRIERLQDDIEGAAFIYAPLLREPPPGSPTHVEPKLDGAHPTQEAALAADGSSNLKEREAELVNVTVAGPKIDAPAGLLTIAKFADHSANNDGAAPTRHTEVVVNGAQASLADGDNDPEFIYPSSLDVPKPAGLAEQPNPDWSTAENQTCRVWNYGNPKYEPFTWSGACVDGRASGEGRLVFRAGDGVYEGGMSAGKMHGHGVLTWSDGFRYEGELRDGMQHGTGTLVRASGERYDGGWREGKPHGHGAYTAAGGEAFEGAWRDGCFSGRDGRRAWLGVEATACGFE